MKILVVGSLHEKDGKGAPIPYDVPYANVKAQFDAACTALGGALAGRDHTIVVGVPHWSMLKAGETAANYVIPGASAEPVRNNQAYTADRARRCSPFNGWTMLLCLSCCSSL